MKQLKQQPNDDQKLDATYKLMETIGADTISDDANEIKFLKNRMVVTVDVATGVGRVGEFDDWPEGISAAELAVKNKQPVVWPAANDNNPVDVELLLRRFQAEYGGIIAGFGDLHGVHEARVDGSKGLITIQKGNAVFKPQGASARPLEIPRPDWPGIVHGGDLVAAFTPPDYHIDGIIQSGFFYSLTASTGTGKTAILLLAAAYTAIGRSLGDRDIKRGRVLYMAGENPSDVTMRWIAMAEIERFDPADIDVYFTPGVFEIPKLTETIRKEVDDLGGVGLVIIDTSAAYFSGSDENSNAEMSRHARAMRGLCELPGSPVVIVACHPVKNASADNLIPRGGGAFIAEVDGNLTCSKSADGTVMLHWQGKHRGPDFKAIPFTLETVTAEKLKDSRGRDIPTVVARAMSDGEVVEARQAERSTEDNILIAIADGATSQSAVADAIGAKGAGSVRRIMERLASQKLIESKPRQATKVTKDGMKVVDQIRRETAHMDNVKESIKILTTR